MATVTVRSVKCEQRCFCHSVNTALKADPALYTTMCYLGIYYDITTKKPLALSPWIYARPIVIGGNWATNKTIATDNFNSYLIICHKTLFTTDLSLRTKNRHQRTTRRAPPAMKAVFNLRSLVDALIKGLPRKCPPGPESQVH